VGHGARARSRSDQGRFQHARTGAAAPNGKQNLLALEIWRDDVNAKGGRLGRPVELVYYDDQSNPDNVAGIYTQQGLAAATTDRCAQPSARRPAIAHG
jgi:hypothetical protein